MRHLTAVVGLPGSGKTRLAESLAKDGGLKQIPDALHPTESDGIPGIIKALSSQDCVIDCVMLTQLGERQKLEAELCSKVQMLKIKWIFFENDPRQCVENILNDHAAGTRANTYDRLKALFGATKYYDLAGHSARPVYRPEGTT